MVQVELIAVKMAQIRAKKANSVERRGWMVFLYTFLPLLVVTMIARDPRRAKVVVSSTYTRVRRQSQWSRSRDTTLFLQKRDPSKWIELLHADPSVVGDNHLRGQKLRSRSLLDNSQNDRNKRVISLFVPLWEIGSSTEKQATYLMHAFAQKKFLEDELGNVSFQIVVDTTRAATVKLRRLYPHLDNDIKFTEDIQVDEYSRAERQLKQWLYERYPDEVFDLYQLMNINVGDVRQHTDHIARLLRHQEIAHIYPEPENANVSLPFVWTSAPDENEGQAFMDLW